MKYYCITTYTCYCGEHFYHYAAIPEGESPEDAKWADLFYGWVADDAAEWISLRKNMTATMIILLNAAMTSKKSQKKSICGIAEKHKLHV